MPALTAVSLRPTTPLPSDSAASEAATRTAPSLPASDLQSLLFQAQALTRHLNARSAGASAEGNRIRRDHALESAREAMKKAEAEQKDAETKGKWIKALQTVATVAAIAAAAVSVFFSAGTSTPAVVALCGVLLSASSPYVAEATGSETAGLTVALIGAAASLGGGAWSLLSSPQAGAALTSAGARIVSTSGQTTAAAATCTAGGATIAKGVDERDAQNARADALTHRAAAAMAERDLQDAIETLRAAEASSRRAMASIMAIGKTTQATENAVLGMLRRV